LNQESPGEQFYDGDGLDDGDRAKLNKLFETLGDQGKISNEQKFKKIDDTEFFEFKSFQIRMPCFFVRGQLVVITHGFFKKKDKTPSGEIDRANGSKMKTNKMSDAKNTQYKDKFQEFIADDERRRLYERESLAFDATELIAHLMAESKVSKAELARRIGKTRSYVTQVLAGSRNLTVYTLADLAFALGYCFELKARMCRRQGEDAEQTSSKTCRMYRIPQWPDQNVYKEPVRRRRTSAKSH